MGFCHLHVHTEYSLLDGACRIQRLLDRAQELGQEAVAITDHGVMYGTVAFYKAAKARGIRPILGCEVYVAPRTRFDMVHELDSENRHLVLLCENETGYRNLMALVSKGWTEGSTTRGSSPCLRAWRGRSPGRCCGGTSPRPGRLRCAMTASSAGEISSWSCRTTAWRRKSG